MSTKRTKNNSTETAKAQDEHIFINMFAFLYGLFFVVAWTPIHRRAIIKVLLLIIIDIARIPMDRIKQFSDDFTNQ